MSHIAENQVHAHHHRPLWQQTEQTIEHKLKHGAPVAETVYHEVHRLLEDEHHRKGFSQAKFGHDVQNVEHELHRKHLLPHLHIASDSAHAGELYAGEHKPGAHGQRHEHGHEQSHEHGRGHAHEAEHEHERRQGAGHGHSHGHSQWHHQAHASHERTRPGQPAPHHTSELSHGIGPEAHVAGAHAARAHSDTLPVPPGIYQQPAFPASRQPQIGRPPQQPAEALPVRPGQDQLPQSVLPSQAAPGQMTSLEQSIQRAANGGRPLSITQIGDSHIAFGTETPAIAQNLAGDLGLKGGQYQYSSYGNVGKTAAYADDHAAEFLKNVNANTDVVLLSFGSNDAAGSTANYTAKYEDLVNKIRQKAPNATIVMVGPTDGNFWNTNRELTGLNQVIAAQKEVAARTPNSMYVDVLGRMGSVSQLRQEGYMLSDNLHLTTKGYQALGRLIAADISQAAH